jgi:hypothetical protein
MDLKDIIKKHLTQLREERTENYMFFSNIEQIKRQCEILLEMDPQFIESILQNGHDWADDHMTTAKENIDQVFDFHMNEEKGGQPLNESEDLEEENVPTNPKLWSRAKAAAKAKYDVYPSAYANGFASKWYKERGGGWKKKSKKK